jgi:hypothetical protein
MLVIYIYIERRRGTSRYSNYFIKENKKEKIILHHYQNLHTRKRHVNDYGRNQKLMWSNAPE